MDPSIEFSGPPPGESVVRTKSTGPRRSNRPWPEESFQFSYFPRSIDVTFQDYIYAGPVVGRVRWMGRTLPLLDGRGWPKAGRGSGHRPRRIWETTLRS